MGLEEGEGAKEVKKKQPQDEGPRCGSCYFWHCEDGGDIGECFGTPPKTVIEDDESWYNERSTTLRTDYPCWFFRAKQ